jgi:hypothetical protein
MALEIDFARWVITASGWGVHEGQRSFAITSLIERLEKRPDLPVLHALLGTGCADARRREEQLCIKAAKHAKRGWLRLHPL